MVIHMDPVYGEIPCPCNTVLLVVYKVEHKYQLGVTFQWSLQACCLVSFLIDNKIVTNTTGLLIFFMHQSSIMDSPFYF